jgi:hypothetical protein
MAVSFDIPASKPLLTKSLDWQKEITLLHYYICGNKTISVNSLLPLIKAPSAFRSSDSEYCYSTCWYLFVSNQKNLTPEH